MKKSSRNSSARDANKGYPRWIRKKYGAAAAGLGFNPLDLTTPPIRHEKDMISQSQPDSSEPQATSTPASANPGPLGESKPEVWPAPSHTGGPGEPSPPAESSSVPMEPDGGAKSQSSVDRSERRADPQNVAEFIEAFYAGRVKALAGATVRRLKSSTIALDAHTRGELLRQATAADHTLDKSRRLMLIATEVDELRALGHLLLEFTAEVVTFHPAVRSNGIRAQLFPNYGDEHALEDAWTALCALASTRDAAAAKAAEASSGEGQATTEGPHAPANSGKSGKVRGPSADVAVARAAAVTANKARRNALLCSVVWRANKSLTTFSEAMRALRNTLFKPPARSLALEAELLEAIALMPEKEDSKVALLLEWQTRQQLDVDNRLSDAIRRAGVLSSQVDSLRLEADAARIEVVHLKRALADERAKKRELDVQLGVVQTHGQHDYETLRAMSLRVIRDASKQLEDVSTALGREPPKVVFAREVLDTIVDALKAADNKLGDA